MPFGIDSEFFRRHALWFMLASGLFYAVMDVCVKSAARLPTEQIVFFRAWVALLLCFGMMRHANIPSFWGRQRRKLIMRGIYGTLGLIMYFYSIQNIPLASAVTIQKLSPIFVMILAAFSGLEKISLGQIGLFLLAFCGILLLKGFDPRISLLETVIAVGSAVFSALAYHTIAGLKDSEHPLVVVMYFPLVTIPVVTYPALVNWVTPTFTEWVALILVGVSVQAAQFTMTVAFQYGQTSKVSLLMNLSAVYALITGWIVFGEHLTGMGLVGIGAILLACTLNALRPKKQELA